MPTNNVIPAQPVAAVNNTSTDAVLWYRVGIYGDLGYGVPNPSNDIGTLNPNIADITNLIGKNLFNMMHHEDVDLTVPPSINTLMRVHQLYVRAGQLLSGRAVPPNVPNMETAHVSPAGDIFRVWPIPYFKVRNAYMRRWASWVMVCLAECFQHTENRKTTEISTAFAAMIGQYMLRIYANMSIELFGKTREEAYTAGFLLKPEDFATYDPAKFFTPTEMVDTVSPLDNVFTEDRKSPLASGIPITELPVLQPYPTNLVTAYAAMREQANATINPDTGQPQTDGSRVEPAPVYPTSSAFVGAGI